MRFAVTMRETGSTWAKCQTHKLGNRQVEERYKRSKRERMEM